VFSGNTADPTTFTAQVNKIRRRFGIQRVVLVGDRGMITSKRIEEDLRVASFPPRSAVGPVSAVPPDEDPE
jgi:transposase